MWCVRGGTYNLSTGYDRSAQPVQTAPRVVTKVTKPVLSVSITVRFLAFGTPSYLTCCRTRLWLASWRRKKSSVYGTTATIKSSASSSPSRPGRIVTVQQLPGVFVPLGVRRLPSSTGSEQKQRQHRQDHKLRGHLCCAVVKRGTIHFLPAGAPGRGL